MPAPVKGELKLIIRTAFVASGNFPNHDKDGNVVPGELPDGLEKIIDAMAEGLANAWLAWQAKQVVMGTATGVTPGPAVVPVVGNLP